MAQVYTKKKVSEITSATEVTGDDLLLAVDAPGSVPATKKLTVTAFATSLLTTLLHFLQSGTGAVARAYRAKLRETVSVTDFGAVGGATDDTTPFEQACTAAVASGVRRVHIPFDTFTVASGGADAAGCVVVGNGKTVINGTIEDATYMEGVIVNGINQAYAAQHPTIPFDREMKAIQWIDANQRYVYVQNAVSGYALIILRNNVTTNGSDSLASTTSDETQWRVGRMLHCVEVLTGFRTPDGAGSGTWADQTLTAGVPTFDAGEDYAYTRSSDSGAYQEYTITVPEDGFFSVAFVRNNTASTSVTVLVDGVAVDTFSTRIASGTDRLVKQYYLLTPGVRTIRVLNNVAEQVNLIGLNFAPLRDQRNDVDVDTLGYYRNGASFISPIDANSANDYAIMEESSADYGGSYHGGESGFTLSTLVDGTAVTLAEATPLFLGRTIELHQASTITWGGGTPTVAVRTRLAFIVGGYAGSQSLTKLTGTLRVTQIYPTLVGVNEDYTHLTFPILLDFSTVANDARYPLGLTQAVEYWHSTTGQRLRITHSTFTHPENSFGGAFVWKVNGTYKKYYNPYVIGGSREVNSLASVVIVQAS